MNKEKEFDNQPIPYILYESEMARHERAIKRLVIAIIVIISMLFVSNLAWLYAWNSYDYVGTETTTEYTQDGEGINIIGDSNEVADESADGEKGQNTKANLEKQKKIKRNKDTQEMNFDEISATALRRLIDEWIHNERDRNILKRRLIDGVCYEPLAEEFDLSVRQIKNIVYKAQNKLFKHLQE